MGRPFLFLAPLFALAWVNQKQKRRPFPEPPFVELKGPISVSWTL